MKSKTEKLDYLFSVINRISITDSIIITDRDEKQINVDCIKNKTIDEAVEEILTSHNQQTERKEQYHGAKN